VEERFLRARFGFFMLVLAGGCGTEVASAPRHDRALPPAVAVDASTENAAAKDASTEDAGVCPAEMVLVQGSYCPNVSQICKRWTDPPGTYHEYRCAEYADPVKCLGERENKRFCIDREELVKPGESLPLAHQSWTSADGVCKSRGARLCLESEWQFACEGEAMHPYPYGDGFKRDSTACNADRTDLGRPNAGLKDLRAPVDAFPKCVSPFGVHDMTGNVEEWATQDHGHLPDRSAMKGAWWLPGKNFCRAVTLGHGETYEGTQMGIRCCKDPP
jgi:formylglycine-generating enzyme